MVIIRVNKELPPENMANIAELFQSQARKGVIVVPACCEVLNEVPADEEIQIMRQDTRVAELEAELARAMYYISAQKDCTTCKHEMPAGSTCPCECEWCNGEPCKGICKTCTHGSNWEWRGASK